MTLACMSVNADAQELELFLSFRGAVEIYPVENRSAAGYLTYSGPNGQLPLVIQVTLANRSGNTIRVERENGWLGALSVRMEPLDGRMMLSPRPFDVVRVREEQTGLRADPTIIAPDTRQQAHLLLKPVPWTNGVYRFRAVIDRADLSGLPSQTGARLSPSETLEIRDVWSLHDRLNYRYTLASTLRGENRHREARSELMLLLAARATSVIAWVELGYNWATDGNCDAAADAFRRAEDLIRTGADPEERSARNGARLEMPQQMKRRLESCVSSAKSQ
jgi:hypothetical protein